MIKVTDGQNTRTAKLMEHAETKTQVERVMKGVIAHHENATITDIK